MDMLKFNISKPTVAKFLNETTKKSVFWAFLYFFGYLHLDIRWFLVFVGVLYLGNVLRAAKKWKGLFWVAAREEETKQHISDIPGNMPDWVLNPDIHRSEWTNTVIKHLWPHFEEHVKQILRSIETDEELKKRLAGYHIKSVKFPEVSLGKIPPRLSGVKVHSSTFSSVQRDEIILDLSMQYAGDLSITMEVDLGISNLPPAKASITQVSLASSCLRVHLRPLLEDVPFVGACTISFLKPPDFDFDLDGLANALSIPGVSLLLRHVIQDQLEQTIVMPNSLTISLVENMDNIKSRNIRQHRPKDTVNTVVGIPSGVLNINVVEAKGLENKDITALGQGKSDPYAVLDVISDGEISTFKTHVIKNNLHPVWNVAVDLPVDNPESLQDMVVNVYDRDVGSKDDYLGKCKISTNVIRTAMTSGQLQDVWKLLEDVKRGSIHIEIGWGELKLNPSLPSKDEGGYAMRPGTCNGTGTGHHQAVITIVIDSCQNLPNTNERNKMKLPNPSVQCQVCEVTQITDPVIGTINPIFAHRMNFLVNDPDLDYICFSVVDEKGKKGENVILGSTKVNISDLLVRTSLTMVKTKFPLENKKKRNQEAELQEEVKRCPMIVVSMALRYIHRPKTSGYGRHKSLQDLHQIMQTKSSVAGAALWRDLGEEDYSKTVDIKNAINRTKNNIETLDDKIRYKSRQGSQLVKDGAHRTGEFIYEKGEYGTQAVRSRYEMAKHKGAHGAHAVKGSVHKVDAYVKQKSEESSQMMKEAYSTVYVKGIEATEVVKEPVHTTGNFIHQKGSHGSQAVKTSYEIVKDKGAHGAHLTKDSVHKVDAYVKQKSEEGSQMIKETYDNVCEKSVDAKEGVRESVHKMNEYVHQKGIDGAHSVKESYNAVYDKGVKGTQVVKDKLHKVDDYVHQTGAQGSHMVKHSMTKVDEKARKTAAQSSQIVKDTSHRIYQKGVDGSHVVKENVHKMDDFVRQTSAQGSQAVKENIAKADETIRKTGTQSSKMIKDGFGKVQEGIHTSNAVYNQSPYLETDFNQTEKKNKDYFNGVTNGNDVTSSKSYDEFLNKRKGEVKPNFITTNDNNSVVTTAITDSSLVAPLAQEESLTITNGFHSLASTETDTTLFKIKPEDATKYVKENSVRSNIIDVVKQPPEPPKPKIQISLKYNLTNMTLSVVVHKIRNLQETSVTWLPSAKVVTRVIEMNGMSRFRRVVNTKRKTKTQRHNVNPVFEETLEYFLPVGDVRRRRLEVSVYHDSRFPGRFIGRNVVLGRCLINLDSIADSLSENLEKSGTRNATVTEWHVLREPVKNEDVDEKGFLIRRGTISRSTSADRNNKNVEHSSTLPRPLKGTKKSGSCKSLEKY